MKLALSKYIAGQKFVDIPVPAPDNLKFIAEHPYFVAEAMYQADDNLYQEVKSMKQELTTLHQ